ncbi:MAG: DEAD/DEAH box helicase, partial [Crenarchaeota archaeon]|nr:DEAD/DEAH box helicase [Thermoproteota archaeon]
MVSNILGNIARIVKTIIHGFRYHPYFLILRYCESPDEPLHPYAHQVELLSRILSRRPIRVLIGDEIGLGKTVEAILVIKYLHELGEAKRTLILVPRTLVHQWVSELKRFGFIPDINVYKLERNTTDKYLVQGFPHGIYIASIDFLKRENNANKILKVSWDIVVVDEAHRVGKIGNRETQRYKLVSALVRKQGANVIFLSATPHRGKVEDYIERIKLVDIYLKGSARELDTIDFYRTIVGSIVFRRTKIDVNEIYEKRKVFTDCKFKARVIKASDEEIKFHNELIAFLRRKLLEYYDKIGEEPRALPLLLTLIAKRASSSPRAALITLNRILMRRSESLISRKSGKDLSKVISELDKEAELIADSILGLSYEDVGLIADESEIVEKIDPDDALEKFIEKCHIFLNDEDIKIIRSLYELASSIRGEN